MAAAQRAMLLLTCMALQLLGASLSPSAEPFPLYDPLPVTGVTFDTTDAPLRGLYHRAATLEPQNSRAYLTSPRFDVLIEGAEYIGAWIETQPMAGGMMASRDVRLALNAQLVFVRSQRSDGRLPHAVWPCLQGNCTATAQGTGLNAGWCLTLQGAYFASPAVDVAWFMRLAGSDNQADAYLAELAVALERYDDYLWSTRNDSTCIALRNFSVTDGANCPATPSPGAANHRGLLWSTGTRGKSTGDTGEDHSTKFCRSQLPNGTWADCEGFVLSMDMVGYSHDMRRSLARIAALRGDRAAAARWTAAAAELTRRAKVSERWTIHPSIAQTVTAEGPFSSYLCKQRDPRLSEEHYTLTVAVLSLSLSLCACVCRHRYGPQSAQRCLTVALTIPLCLHSCTTRCG